MVTVRVLKRLDIKRRPLYNEHRNECIILAKVIGRISSRSRV